MRAISVALLVCLAAPGLASAQADDGAQATFADATGAMWGTASFEAWLLAEGIAVGVAEGCGGDSDEIGCVALLALSCAAVGVSSGVVASQRDAPPEAPFVAHHALWGGAAMLSLGVGLAGDDDGLRGALGVIGLLAGSGALSAYTWARRDRLLHDPEGAAGAHLMTWGVPATTLLAALLAGISSEDGIVTALAVGLASVAMYGLSIAVAES